MPETGQTVATQALKKAGILGIGRPATQSELNDALSDLNDMIAQWRTKRWMVWTLTTLSKVSTGAQWYTIGPGGDFDTGTQPRPTRLEAAFVRQTNQSGLPVDYPLKVIPAKEEYSALAVKSLVSFPQYIYMDTEYPLAKVTVYPIANANIYSIFVLFKSALISVAANTDLSALPDFYIPALKFNLAKRLRQAFGKGLRPDPELNVLARDALDTVKQANQQVPELAMPKNLLRPTLYDIRSDQSY